MNLCPIQISLLFVHFLLTSRIGSSSSTLLTGDVSINCGSNGASTARNGRQWLGDVQPKPSSLLQINGKSTTSTVTNKLTLDDPVPHKTARISRSRFSYAFQVDPGQKIIRLHFTPSPYKGFRDFKDFFTVQSGGFTFLRNFSASLTADALRVNTFSKEFCLNIQKKQQLNDSFLIGKGGFGSVYKGLIDGGATTVAIKRVTHDTDRVASALKSEIRILSALRHRHLVPLIGYCDEKRELILVYEYMVQGTLHDYLYDYKSANSPLTWKQRLEICLGAAKGLEYLHTGAEHAIIHRNVKSSNILLDENWAAKMSGFDLSSKVIYDTDWSQVSTVVQGSYGYLDPEYFQSSRLTFKSDVYSFGIVLFETLCGRRPIISSLPSKQANLATWGSSCFQKGKLDKIIDSNLRGQIAPECLKEFAELAVACVSLIGNKRRVMRDVVRSLEFAMQLQEAVAIDEAPSTMMTSHIDMVKSQYEHGLESTQNQKAKLLPLSSVKQSDDSPS